jgi:hypothetical protein
MHRMDSFKIFLLHCLFLSKNLNSGEPHFDEFWYTQLCGNSFSGYREHSQSSVYIMGRMIQGLIPGSGRGVFSSEKHPEHRCSTTTLLMNLVAGVLSPWEEQPRL